MSGRRKPSRRPTASKYRNAQTRPRPVGMMGGGQGGILGGPSSGGLQ
jgi:hypothetical protein